MMEKIQLTNWCISGGKYVNVAATVPGDVLNTLYSAGCIADPLYADNLQHLNDVFESDWTYSCRFDVPKNLLETQKILLTLEGIDTLAEIRLNGNLLGNTDNMFLRYDYDIKECLKEEDNELSVKIFSAINFGKAHPHSYQAIFNSERLMLRKAQCQFGWDWAPYCPSMGIWLPCYITFGDENRIDNVQIRTTLDGDASVIVTLSEKEKNYYTENDYRLRIRIDGQSKECKATHHASLINFKVENAKLWWPNGYGEQSFYEYKVELLKKGVCVEEKKGRFAFKQVRVIEKAEGLNQISFAIEVNGRKIFAKGSNWVPASATLGALNKETYAKLISHAKDAHYNILRVWGGGIYETECFYDLCDEAGILVWQDFAFACSEIPFESEFEENVRKEAEYQIKRLRNRPSLGLFCGSNEAIEGKNSNMALLRYVLRGYMADLAPDVPYLYNSPCSWTDDAWHKDTGDAHDSCMQRCLDADDVINYRKYIAENKGWFLSECTALGPSRIRSLKRFTPKKAIKTDSDILEYHFVKNPYLPNPEETFLMKEKRYAEGLFGDISNMEKFVKKAQIAHAEVLAAEIFYARSRKECTGFMNWMYNDTWGCGTWSVVDYYMERKPAYYYQKRAFEPLALFHIEEDGQVYVCIANDTNEEVRGVFTYLNKTLDGGGIDGSGANFCVPPYSVERFPIEIHPDTVYATAGIITESGDALGIHYFPHGWNYPFKTDIRLQISEQKEEDEYVYVVSIYANEYARVVFVDTPNNAHVTYSDNFFDIEKGKQTDIVLRSKERIDVSTITVKTFADEWKD